MNFKNKKIKTVHAIKRTVISVFLLLIITFLINVAPNYVKEAEIEKTELVINNMNVTKSLKLDIIKQDDAFYISTNDYKNFFDEFIIEDGDYIITTADKKTAKISKNNTTININGALSNIKHTPILIDDQYYLPAKDMKDIYDYEYEYDEKNNIIMLSSLNRKYVKATSSKNQSVKYTNTIFSKTVDNIDKGEKVVIVQDKNYKNDIIENGWVKVRTSHGKIGYVKKSSLINEEVIRNNIIPEKIEGKVSIAWDYFSSSQIAPSRTGKIEGINVVSPSFYNLQSDGNIISNVGESGNNYIEWAHNNNYKVWATLSNIFLNNLDEVSEMMNSFDSRENLIENIVKVVVENDVDGIIVDFENMYKEDKDKYSRFIIELAPRMEDIGKTLSVIVTAPDGADTWSLCYDRYTIGKAADYVIFLGYDQTSASSKVAATTSGYDWQTLNIKKMLGQEGVPANKLIVASSFYTRLWRVNSNNVVVGNSVVNMNKIYIPSNASKSWDENTKQNYIEYESNASKYKIWLEDEQSISCKLDLINEYNLAGAGFWELDRETAGVWKIIGEKLKVN